MFRLYSLENQPKYTVTSILVRLAFLCIGCILLLYIIALFPQMFRLKDSLLESTFPINMAAIGLLLAAAVYYILLKKRTKQFCGTLSLHKDHILLNDEMLPLEKITKLRFIGNDILGDFRGYVSKGTENSVEVQLADGRTVTYGMEQTPTMQLKQYQAVLVVYKETGILTEANYQNILNNTNYY